MLFLEYDLPPLKRLNLMSRVTVETVRLCDFVGNPGRSMLGLGLCYYYYYFIPLVGRYIPEGFEKKMKKNTNK